MNTSSSFDIFRAGTHTAMSGVTLSFSESDLDGIVRAYDPARHEAPLVVGHPRDNLPAYGWVRALSRDGDRLRAEPVQLDADFAELVRAGRFKKVSASFYAPDSPANPAPGSFYLRHVGFLGAQPPAVKGLREIQFADTETGVITLEFGESDPPPIAEPPMPDAKSDASELKAELQAELDAKAAALNQLQAELDARAAALAAQEAAARVSATAAFAERLIGEGRLLPKDKAGLVAFMTALPSDATLAFGEGDSAFNGAPGAWLETFLAQLPVQVDYAERAGAEHGAPDPVAAEIEASARRMAGLPPADSK